MIITLKKKKKNVMKRIYKGTFYSGLKFDYILIIWYYFDDLQRSFRFYSIGIEKENIEIDSTVLIFFFSYSILM